MSAPQYSPAAGIFVWLRSNLSVTIFVCGLFSSGVAALVSVTLRIAAFEAQLMALSHDAIEQADHLARLDGERHGRDELQVKGAADLSVINQRLAVLESQIRWIGDRLDLSGGRRSK